MKRLFSCSVLTGIGLLFFSSGSYAACDEQFTQGLGSSSYAIAAASGALENVCSDNGDHNYSSTSNSASAFNYKLYGDKKVPVRTKSSARSNMRGLSVSGGTWRFGGDAGSGKAYVKDVFTISVGNDHLDTEQVIPYTFCARYNSSNTGYGGNSINFGIVPSWGQAFNNGPTVFGFPYGSGSGCTTGSVKFTTSVPRLITLTASSNLSIGGNPKWVKYSDVWTTEFNGAGAGVFSIDASGFDCVSTSGDAAGCELPPIDAEEEVKKAVEEIEKDLGNSSRDDSLCQGGGDCMSKPKALSEAERIAQAEAARKALSEAERKAKADVPKNCTFAGNPINFLYGYKLQIETDYSGEALSFSRNYRSDKLWAGNSIGNRWHHNFDRTLTITTDKVELVDVNGRVVHFYNGGSSWLPVHSDVTETFESDGSGGFIYTRNDEAKEYYNSAGKLVRVESSGGEAINLSYVSGKLNSVADENGNTLSFTYNALNFVSSVVTPAGTFTYSYTGDNLTQVTKPDNSVRIYHYEDANFPNALTGITDENGNRYATYTYDSDGRAIRSEHYGAEEDYDVSYNADDSVTVTNPLGKQTTYHYTGINGLRKITNVEGHASASCAAANKGYTYTPEGWLESVTDWEGKVTSYGYDTEGRVKEVIKDFGGLDQHDIDYTYISGKKLIDTVTQGNFVIDYDYDAFDRVTSITRTDTTTSEARITTYSYYANTTDANGNAVLGKLQTVDGARTDVTDTTTLRMMPICDFIRQRMLLVMSVK